MTKRKARPVAMPIMATKCATCPFRPGSGTEYLAADLTASSLNDSTRICHSTGGNDVIIPASKNYFQESHVCRGSRDLQLQFFHRIGFLTEPTDEAWAAKCTELGM